MNNICFKMSSSTPFDKMVTIGIFTFDKDGYNSTSNAILVLTWSFFLPEKDGTVPEMFSFRAKVDIDNLNDFEVSVKVARKVLKTMDYDHSILSALDAMSSLKIVEVVYDTRKNQLVPLDLVKGPEFKAYADDYVALSNPSGWTYEVLAESEQGARMLILNKAGRRGNTDFLKKFVQADMPVRLNKYATYPDTTTARERLESEFTNE